MYSPAALLWPFDISMWVAISLSTVLCIFFFVATSKVMDRCNMENGKSWPLAVQIMFLLSTILEQDSPILERTKAQPLRVFVIMWFFFIMILTNVYRSKMVTLLAFPVLGSLPETFEELAFSDYHVGFIKYGDSAYNTLAASTDPVYVKLVKEMETFGDAGLECMEKIFKFKYACIGYSFALKYLIEKNLSDSDTRKLVTAPATTYNVWLGLSTEGRSIYRVNFGKWLGYTRQFHLADIWKKIDMYYNVRLLKLKWWEATHQSEKMRWNEVESDNLTMKHIAGTFYVLGVCLALSCAIFIQEAWLYHKKALAILLHF